MRLKACKRKSGFNLVEMIAATAIFIILAVITLSFFVQGSNMWRLTSDQSDLRSFSRSAIAYMTQELRSATRRPEALDYANDPPYLYIPPKPNNNSITFYLPLSDGAIVDTAGNTIWDTDHPVQYYYNAGTKQLLRQQDENQRIIANDVSSVAFEDSSTTAALNISQVKITLTIAKTSTAKITTNVTLTGIVKLQN
jgi:type II secretory pathway pseudopilin PulG